MPNVSNGAIERNVVHIKRLQRAGRKLNVIPRDPERGLYLVESATTPGRCYEVAVDGTALRGSCTCPWAAHGGINCKHILAALQAHYRMQGRLSFWRSPADARRQHRRTLAGNHLFVTFRTTGRSLN